LNEVAGAHIPDVGASRPWSSPITVLQIAVVAAAYFITARIGLGLDAVAGFATLVWPASGIALASVLVFGFRLWPAIAIGAFAVNLMAGAPVPAAIGIAIGNTGEAILGAYLLRRVGVGVSLERVRDVIAFIVLAAMVSTLVAATVGVTSILAAGRVAGIQALDTWKAWWIGDGIGDLLVAPLILAWAAWAPKRQTLARAGEAALLAVTVIGAGILVFGDPDSAFTVARGREYMLFPPLIWASLRFSVRGTVLSTVAVSILAIVFTVMGRGPFVRGDLHESLLALQVFLGITSTTFLFLGAAIAERRRAIAESLAARETAEAANHAKSGFLAVISHELRTPLNAITGYVDLLSLEVHGKLTSEQHAVLGRIAQSQRHLLSLIDDVLGFAQVEAGRLSFSLQPVNVAGAMTGIEPLVGTEMLRKGLRLDVGECDESLSMMADPGRVRQILLNLVTNAMKFTPGGGSISINAEARDGTVRIAVSDTGIGIAQQHLSRVFDPFYQVDQGGTRRYPGLGLGLSIVRDVVLAMNGDVAIESVPGTGTTVTVSLPRVDVPCPVLEEARSAPGDVQVSDA
jgi:signal transduction histidine kinase